MKPVFYKKLVPLAMIASMAVSNLSVAAEAAVVKPAAPAAVEETTVDEIEVPDIAASAVKVYAADAVEASLSVDGENAIKGTFSTSDADDKTVDIDLTFKVTGDFDSEKFTLVSDNKDTDLASGITVAAEPTFADGKVTATITVAKSVKTGAKILLKGETTAKPAVEADPENNVEAADAVPSKIVYSDAYSYTRVENKVTTSITVDTANATSKIKYDVFDPDSASRDVQLTFTLTKDASAKIDVKKLALVSAAVDTEDNNKITTSDLDKSIKATYKLNDEKTAITVTASIPKSLMVSDQMFALTYKESSTSTITSSGVVTVSKDTPDYLGKDAKGTVVENKVIKGYYGTATDIVISDGNINGIATGVFKDNKTIKSVKCSHSSDLNVDSKAFENCPNLVLIDLGRANDTSTFNEEAIVNCEKAFVRTEQSATGALATALKKIKNPVINASITATVDNSGETITKAGDILKANLLAEMVIYNGDMYKMTKSDSEAAAPTDEQLAKAKWVVYDINKSTAEKNVASSAAKFSNGVLNAKTKQLTYSASNITGEVALIGNLKSAGAFNSAVRLVAQIPTFKEDGKTIEKYTDYAEFSFYVNPQEATEFKAVKPVTGKFEAVADAENTYTLTVAENASYKIPLALADGQNKTLEYKAEYATGDEGSFTVLNGTVKGLKAGTGTITVKSQDGTAEATVNVTVKQAVKGLKSSVASLSIANKLEQSFTIAPTTSAGAFNVTVDFDTDKYDLVPVGGTALSKESKTVSINGAQEFTIKLKDTVTLKSKSDFTASMNNVTFTYTNASGKAATLKVKLAYAAAPADAKSIKQAVKKAKNADTVKVAVPVGGIYNLGVAVNPTTAQNKLEWQVMDGGEWKSFTYTIGDPINIKGGVIVANAATNGTPVMVKAVVPNTTLESDVFEISTYKASSSIVWDENAEYVLRGGFLVDAADVKTTCKKELNAGKSITFNAPTASGGTENIIWTANKPSSVFIDVKDGKMTIKPLAKGTYTITGVTEYTKQKMSFKVSVGDEPATSTDKAEDAVLKWKKVNTDPWSDDATITANIGDKIQFGLDSDVTGTAPKFESTAPKVAAVNAAGLVTVKTAGETTIKAGGKEVKITVNATATDAKLKVPTFVKAGGEFTATTALKDAKWYYISDNKVTPLEAGTGKNKYKLPAAEGNYTLYAWVGTEAPADVDALKAAPSAEINVYSVVATKAAVLDPWEWKNSDGSDGKSFGSLKDMANAKLGIEQGYGFVLPVTATGVDGSGKTVKASDGEIVWTSSNSNIAWVDSNAVDPAPVGTYAGYTVKTSENYTGKVTLTGTLVNSGKKVKITLNVVAATSSTPTT